MKRTIILVALIASSGAIAMQEDNKEPKNYYYSFAATKDEDDTTQNISIARPLLLQLCVHASKEHALDQKPFKDLLQRLKAKTINHDEQVIRMTTKDGYHRLLTYIPCENAYSLVNGKKIRLSPTQVMEETEAFYLREDDCYIDGEPQFTGETVISTVYDFEKQDAEHHAKVVAAFAELIAK